MTAFLYVVGAVHTWWIVAITFAISLLAMMFLQTTLIGAILFIRTGLTLLKIKLGLELRSPWLAPFAWTYYLTKEEKRNAMAESSEGGYMRGYVIGWKERENATGEHTPVDVAFDHRLEKAVCWKTREQAEYQCKVLDSYHIVIPSSKGGTHTCEGFKAEERAPREFVILCEGPFVLRA